MTNESSVLHTKYRPKAFKQVTGQDHIIEQLQKILAERSSHAFLFHGPAGCGKTTLARLATKELGCAPKDVMEIDAATKTGVDDVRAIQMAVRYKPLGGGDTRAVIIDEAHRISVQAFDSLLKIMEESPVHLFWFLCTTLPQKVPSTVESRR